MDGLMRARVVWGCGQINAESMFKKKLIGHAIKVGEAKRTAEMKGESPSTFTSLQHDLLDKVGARPAYRTTASCGLRHPST
jgi:hypothetical protein